MKLYVLDNGKIVMSGNNNVTLENNQEGEKEVPAIPIHSFLLDSPIGFILFDAACDPEGMNGVWPSWLLTNPYEIGENGSVPERLAQLGIQPEEIKIIVLSHLHMDHAGCLKFFPHAKVYVHEDELETVLKNYAADKLEGSFHLKSDVESWLKAGIRWRPVDREVKELPLCENITILNFGSGHSYGMLGLFLELKCGNLVLAADSIYSREHFGPPAKMAGVCSDEAGYYKTIETIREFASSHHAKILFGHDMPQFRSLKKSTEGWYD